jgi:hypothetical protein
MRGQLSGTEKARFCTKKLFNCAKYDLDSVLDLDPEPEPKLKPFRSRNRNRNKSLPGTVPQHCFLHTVYRENRGPICGLAFE